MPEKISRRGLGCCASFARVFAANPGIVIRGLTGGEAEGVRFPV